MDEDISQPKKRSLREIFPEVGRGRSETTPKVYPMPEKEPKFTSSVRASHSRKFAYKIGGLIVIVLVVLIAGYFVSSAFAGATVIVTPKQGELTISGVHQADNIALVGTSTALRFHTSGLIEETETMKVPSAGVKEVSEKASGQIVIESKLEAPQQLVATTRFEAPNGNIYRIKNDVTVPAAARNSTGALSPGQLEVTVYADKPGEEYNLERAEFTVPGFKGGSKFTLFSAKTKTALTGGFVGKANTISDEDKKRAQAELETTLKAKIKQRLADGLTENDISFDDGVIIDYVVDVLRDETGEESNEVTVQGKAIAAAILFNKRDFGKYFAGSIPGYHGEEVEVANPNELKFELENKSDLNTANLESITFTLEGIAKIVWQFDSEKLIADLQAAENKNYNAVFVEYPEIQKADIKFSPAWIKRFPDNSAKVKVDINTADEPGS